MASSTCGRSFEYSYLYKLRLFFFITLMTIGQALIT